MECAYEEGVRSAARVAISKGHHDLDNLRELLIWTTSMPTCAMVEEYFSQHHDDEKLLAVLIEIALEGEDMGDSPWAAANTAADFPAQMPLKHKAALVDLSKHEWMYLKLPAQKALAKITLASEADDLD